MSAALNQLQPPVSTERVTPRDLDLTALAEQTGCNWVMTWPKQMQQLDVDQLVMLKRDTAMHRAKKRAASDASKH